MIAEHTETRAKEFRFMEDSEVITDRRKPNLPDYDEWDRKLKEWRAFGEVLEAEKRLEELRYNHNHNPYNGQFASAGGYGSTVGDDYGKFHKKTVQLYSGGSGGIGGTGVDKGGNSDIIKENSDMLIQTEKVTKFLLKPNAKHSDDFFEVGYTVNDYEKLANDIEAGFDLNKAVDIKKSADGSVKFSIFMNLGITKKKSFRTVWKKKTSDSKARFITGHREDKNV